MAAHHQLLYHIVFSTKERRPLLQNDQLREQLWAYMAGVAKNLGGFAIRIGGYYDHAHLLVRIPAKVAVSDFVGKLKANTSEHINEIGRAYGGQAEEVTTHGLTQSMCCLLHPESRSSFRAIYQGR